MNDRVCRYAVVTALVTAAFVVAAGCATLRPPVQFDSRSPTESTSAVELSVREGRPNGLLLELALRDEVSESARALQLLRAEAGMEPQIYREIRLDEALLEALRTDGVEFLDRNVAAGVLVRYQLRLVGSEDQPLAYSKLLRLTWKAPPRRARGLTGEASTPSTVELRWSSPPTHGAVIFRRNVLRDDSTPERIADIGPDSAGVFVDTDVQPGVVYAYRISLAVDRGEFLQLAPPSEPVYVDVPRP